jgi:biotin operon repressor
MGRPQRITPYEVLESLKRGKCMTRAQLAQEHECTEQTIRSKVRQLRNDGEKIIFNQNGLFMLDEITNENELKEFKDYEQWASSTIKGLIQCMKPSRQIWKDSIQYLRIHFDAATRKQLKKYHLSRIRFLEYAEIEDELDD